MINKYLLAIIMCVLLLFILTISFIPLYLGELFIGCGKICETTHIKMGKFVGGCLERIRRWVK